MKPVSVAAFNSREEAELLRVRLMDAGIEAEIRNELPGITGLEFARASAGVRIEVPREAFETALQVVYGWNAGEDGGQSAPPPEWMMVPSSRPAGGSASLRARAEPGQST